jgi:hypothetical protein
VGEEEVVLAEEVEGGEEGAEVGVYGEGGREEVLRVEAGLRQSGDWLGAAEDGRFWCDIIHVVEIVDVLLEYCPNDYWQAGEYRIEHAEIQPNINTSP